MIKQDMKNLWLRKQSNLQKAKKISKKLEEEEKQRIEDLPEEVSLHKMQEIVKENDLQIKQEQPMREQPKNDKMLQRH